MFMDFIVTATVDTPDVAAIVKYQYEGDFVRLLF